MKVKALFKEPTVFSIFKELNIKVISSKNEYGFCFT